MHRWAWWWLLDGLVERRRGWTVGVGVLVAAGAGFLTRIFACRRGRLGPGSEVDGVWADGRTAESRQVGAGIAAMRTSVVANASRQGQFEASKV